MAKEFKRFDMKKPPRRFMKVLRPIAHLLCAPAIKKYNTKVTYKNGAEDMKGPFILLCNHNAFLDFKVCYTLLKNQYANFVVAIDGYLGREWLLRDVGCICKRKFTKDLTLVRHIKTVLERGDIAVIYPEARYSLCGTTAILPESLGKMAKMFKVPILTLICHGHHVNSPFWDTSHERGIAYNSCEYNVLIKPEELESLSIDEINERIVNEFQYDDFKWQKDNNIIIDDPKRADGLDKVLYQCPNCGTEYEMTSSGTKLICNHCHKEWEMTELGELKATTGETEFSHIPDWYEWERENVRKEVQSGTYTTGEVPVEIESLPNAKKYIKIGTGKFIHDMNGFYVKLDNPELSDTNEMRISVLDAYSTHIEYRYLFKHGDCIDLNTIRDTWYIYPKIKNINVTKISLATEELYKNKRELDGKPCKKGLA